MDGMGLPHSHSQGRASIYPRVVPITLRNPNNGPQPGNLSRQFGESSSLLKSSRDPIVGVRKARNFNLTDDEESTEELENMQLSREELQAHLAANKAEVNSVASEMRREMADFRALQSQQFANLSSSLSDIKGEITSLRGEMAGSKDGVTGQIDGLKSAVSTMQWMVGTVLAMIGIAVAILAIPGIEKII